MCLGSRKQIKTQCDVACKALGVQFLPQSNLVVVAFILIIREAAGYGSGDDTY